MEVVRLNHHAKISIQFRIADENLIFEPPIVYNNSMNWVLLDESRVTSVNSQVSLPARSTSILGLLATSFQATFSRGDRFEPLRSSTVAAADNHQIRDADWSIQIFF